MRTVKALIRRGLAEERTWVADTGTKYEVTHRRYVLTQQGFRLGRELNGWTQL